MYFYETIIILYKNYDLKYKQSNTLNLPINKIISEFGKKYL